MRSTASWPWGSSTTQICRSSRAGSLQYVAALPVGVGELQTSQVRMASCRPRTGISVALGGLLARAAQHVEGHALGRLGPQAGQAAQQLDQLMNVIARRAYSLKRLSMSSSVISAKGLSKAAPAAARSLSTFS